MSGNENNPYVEPKLLRLLEELEKEYGIAWDRQSYEETRRVEIRAKGHTILKFTLENWEKREIAEGEIRNAVENFLGPNI